MTGFFIGLALGVAAGYCISKPDMVKGWIDALRAKLGK